MTVARAPRSARPRVLCRGRLAARRRPREPIGRGVVDAQQTDPLGLKVLPKSPPSYRGSWASVNVDHFDRGRS
jgi:hypothetical protein